MLRNVPVYQPPPPQPIRLIHWDWGCIMHKFLSKLILNVSCIDLAAMCCHNTTPNKYLLISDFIKWIFSNNLFLIWPIVHFPDMLTCKCCLWTTSYKPDEFTVSCPAKYTKFCVQWTQFWVVTTIQNTPFQMSAFVITAIGWAYLTVKEKSFVSISALGIKNLSVSSHCFTFSWFTGRFTWL